MSHWLSIEVLNGSYAARAWADANGDALVEAAVTAQAIDWEMKRTAWGVVFEVEFRTDAECDLFKRSGAVVEAIKSAPDPQTGVLIYKGRSAYGGATDPRKPKPVSGAGSAALPLPINHMPFLEPLPAFFSGSTSDRRTLTKSR